MTNTDKMNRRKFLMNSAKSVATLTVAMKLLPLEALATESLSDTIGGNCNGKVTGLDPSCDQILQDQQLMRVKSGRSRYFPDSSHVHFFDIPLSVFRNPPEGGVSFETTVSLYPFKHHHTVKLSQDQLMTIAQGQAVQFSDGKLDHKYLFQLNP